MRDYVVDVFLSKMYSTVERVIDWDPPYLWSGEDPKKGMDCSGFTTYVLGKAGYNTDRKTALGYREGLFVRDSADPALGPRAEELSALFIVTSSGDVTHIALHSTPQLVTHIAPPFDLLAPLIYYGWGNDAVDPGLYNYVTSQKQILPSGNTEFDWQAFRHRATLQALSGAGDPVYTTRTKYTTTERDDVFNQMELNFGDAPIAPRSLRALGDWPYLTINEVKGILAALHQVSWDHHGTPPSVILEGKEYEYARSAMLDVLGITRIQWETLAAFFNWNKPYGSQGGVITLSEEKYKQFYPQYFTGVSVVKGYMSEMTFQRNFVFDSVDYPIYGHTGK
jgi:hypothetical protein